MRFNIRNIFRFLSVAVVATSRWALPSTSQSVLAMALPNAVAGDGTAHFSFDMTGVDINSIDMTGVDLDTIEEKPLDLTEATGHTNTENTTEIINTDTENQHFFVTDYNILYNRGIRLAGFDEFPPRCLTPGDANYYVSAGMNTFTIPFRWESLQPDLSSPIDFTSGFGKGLSNSVENLCNAFWNSEIVLEMSNSMHYNGQVIGGENSTVTTQHFVNAWYQIASHFTSCTQLYSCSMFYFNLMGNPNNCTTELLVNNYNAVWSALNMDCFSEYMLMFEGNGGSEISKWFSNSYGTPNSQLLTAEEFSSNDWMVGVRTFLRDPKTGDCFDPSEVLAAEGVMDFINWANANSLIVFFSAIGSQATPNCIDSLNVVLNTMLQYSFSLPPMGPFYGYTAYTGGYSADYKFDLTPYENGTEKLQMSLGYNLNLAPPAIAPNFTSSNSTTDCFPLKKSNKANNTQTIIEATAIPGAALLAAAAGFFCLRKRCKNNGEQQPLLQENNKRCCV